MQIGGIVLAGGRSRRMGVAKAALRFGPETLLARMVRLVSEVAQTVIVVAAQDQELPPLPSDVLIARDALPGRGPLEGIAAGLRMLPAVDVVYITACDTPLLAPAFIRRLIDLLNAEFDAVAAFVTDLAQPLNAAYRPGILPQVEQMLAKDQLRVLDLLDRVRTRRVLPDELRDVDPDLQSLRNLNTPADFQAALAAAGFADENLT